MATGEFRAEDGAILQGAKIVTEYQEVLTTAIGEVRTRIVDQIGSNWEGEARKQFDALMMTWDRSANKITGNLETFRQRLVSSDEQYTGSESDVKTAMTNLISRLG